MTPKTTTTTSILDDPDLQEITLPNKKPPDAVKKIFDYFSKPFQEYIRNDIGFDDIDLKLTKSILWVSRTIECILSKEGMENFTSADYLQLDTQAKALALRLYAFLKEIDESRPATMLDARIASAVKNGRSPSPADLLALEQLSLQPRTADEIIPSIFFNDAILSLVEAMQCFNPQDKAMLADVLQEINYTLIFRSENTDPRKPDVEPVKK